MKSTVARAVAVASLLFLSGCASIVSKSTWPVTINTTPSGANCVVSKQSGGTVHTGTTPMTVNLASSDGFFSSAKYTVMCQKDGFKAEKVPLEARLNGWYLGNIVFGGVIGLLIVDPATGAMWKLEDAAVVNMAQIEGLPATALSTSTKGVLDNLPAIQ